MDEKRRIVLVGASGRLGRMVLHYWRRSFPGRLAVVPQYRAAVPPGTGLSWSPMAGPQALCDHVARTGPFDGMVMLAGVCPGTGQDVALNAPLAEACLSAAREAGIGRVLLASSSAVYGPGNGTSFAETAPRRPVGAYGRAKRAMEEVGAAWRGRGMEVCCLRIGNVAGADALLTSLSRAAPGRATPIDAFDGEGEGDGGPVRSYVGARTLAEILGTLVLHEGPLPSALNVAAPRPVSMEALARAGDYRYEMRPAPASAHRSITLDCTLLEGLHGFGPRDGDPEEMVAQWRKTLAS